MPRPIQPTARTPQTPLISIVYHPLGLFQKLSQSLRQEKFVEHPLIEVREKGGFIASGFAGSDKHSSLYEKVAEEAGGRPSQLEVEDVSALSEDAQGAEDEISEPEEDSLAGQIAVMRSGSVKKSQAESDDEDDDGDADVDQKSEMEATATAINFPLAVFM